MISLLTVVCCDAVEAALAGAANGAGRAAAVGCDGSPPTHVRAVAVGSARPVHCATGSIRTA